MLDPDGAAASRRENGKRGIELPDPITPVSSPDCDTLAAGGAKLIVDNAAEVFLRFAFVFVVLRLSGAPRS